MSWFAVVGDAVPPGLEPVLVRVLEALSAKGMSMRTHKGDIGNLAMEHFKGGKFSFWPGFEQTGVIVHVDPRNTDLTKTLIRSVPGFARASGHEKSLAQSVAASVIGLDGSGSFKASFGITMEAMELDKKFPCFIALKLGLKLYNIADRKQLSELVSLIRR